MRKIKTGSHDEYIAYLEENKSMDRSVLAFNLSAIFGLKKKEAAGLVREWVLEGCKAKDKKDDSDDSEKEDKDDE